MTIGKEVEQLLPWAGQVPELWRTTRLDDVADVLFSNVDKHTKEGEIPVRLCNYVDVYGNERITREIDFMEATADQREIDRFQIRRGDLVLTKDSEEADDIAIPALVSDDLPGVLCGYHLALVRKRTASVSGAFLFWLHASKAFRAQYEANAVGVTRFGLSQHAFRSAYIPVPSFAEQERIAAYLDASCAAIDSAVASKRRQLEKLVVLRKSIIEKSVIRGVEGQTRLKQVDQEWIEEIPVHWDLCRLKRVLLRMDYGISESTLAEGRFGVLKMGHLSEGEIVLTELDFVDDVEDHLLLDAGDLLFNRTNSPDQVGKAAVFRGSKVDNLTFASYLVRLRTNHRADPMFLNYVLNSEGFLGFARKLAIPSVQQSNLNSTRYSRMLIPLPPLKEQLKIRDYLDKKLAEMKSIANGIEAQISALVGYRKSLIHECVTGQRRLSDADLKRVTIHGPAEKSA